ncbi:glycosyltransferase family 4 protein [Aureibaculum conchae]|uniref:glycosyltransferase family 4 protein n=1 Tax=Aureibaculum sp. 2308TA14-22 TaxID=3108392 RepID=UPI0033977F9D
MLDSKKIKNISFVVGQLGPGGLERQLFLLLNELKKDNININCIVWNFDRDDFYTKEFEQLLGNHLIELKPTDSFFKKMFQLRKYVKSIKPDIIISFSTFTNFTTWVSTLFRKPIAIGSVRTSGKRLIKEISITSLPNLLFPYRLLVNSNIAISELQKYLFFKYFKKITFIRNHLNLNTYKVNCKSKDFFSASVGNFTESKRVDRFVKLFYELKLKDVTHVHKHIGDGNLRSKIEKEKDEKELKNLQFLGYKANIIDVISSASVFIHLSEYEGTPNAVIEALAMGIPVITTNCGDVKDLVIQGKSGYVVENFNTIEITNIYLELVSNREKLEKMSEFAANSVEKLDLKYLKENFYKSLEKLNINL